MKESIERLQYNSLLKSGELFELFPKLSGIWEKDKQHFHKLFLKTDKMVSEYTERVRKK